MGEDVVRPAAVGQHDLLEELLQVCGVVAEAPDIAALAIADQPVGIALAAPVEGGDAKAAIGKVADGFEIFLDALVAAGQDDHGALQRARDRCKQAVADLLAVTGGEEAASGIFRSRIALDFVKKGDFVDKIHHSALRAWRLACPPVLAGSAKVIDAHAPKAKEFRVMGSATGRPEAASRVPPAPVDPGGRDVNTRFGLVAAPVMSAPPVLDLGDTLAPAV